MDRPFPESAERFYSEEFKQKLAISFLDYSVLTDEMIQSRLNNGKFEEWKVELTVLEEKAIVDLSYSNRYIFNPSQLIQHQRSLQSNINHFILPFLQFDSV